MSSSSVQYYMAQDKDLGTLKGSTDKCLDKHCVETVKRHYNFHQLFSEELNNTMGGTSFVVDMGNGVVKIYSDYLGMGAVELNIPIGRLTDPNFDEIKPEDWLFSSSEAMSDIGVDVDQTSFKTLLTDILNRVMLKARR